MAVYFKFKSAKDYDSIPIDGHFISVSTLKEKIFESKHLGRGTDFDLVVTNAHTNEEYLDEDMLIPKNTSVLIRRVPGRPRMPIVTEPVNEQYEPKIENNQPEDIQTAKSSFPVVDSSTAGYPEDVEWDEFGTDLYSIPEAQASQFSNLIHENTIAHSKEDEDSKIKALIDTPVLDWQRQVSDGFGTGRGFGRGGGRMIGGRGFGRGGGVLERKTPPPGYICHRCKVSGHFIQHCPTNGDPNFDIKRVKPPTGIPKSMLMATPDGSYSLPSGAAAVMKPNDDAFLRDIIGLPSTHLVSDLPPELRCPLCAEVMKDAVLTSKCCFRSFCDKCIRNYFMSKKICVCGANNILADDLLPNKTVRDTISRLMESTNSSQENVASTLQVQDMESKFPEPNLKDKTTSSPTLSATSKGKEVVLPPRADEVLKENESSFLVKAVVDSSDKVLEKSGTGKVPDVSEATHDSISVKEPASQISAPLMDEEVQQKPIISDAGKKKKKKKTRPPMNAAEMQWKMSQDLAAENYMMPMGGPAAYNPYWNGMQPGMEAYGAPHYPGALPYMGYGFSGPLDPFGMMPQDPFVGVQQGFMMPPVHPPQRDLAEMGMGFNMGHHPHQPPPIMSREEFEARKADLRMKREFERRGAVAGGERRDLSLSKDQLQTQPQPQQRRQVSSSSRDGPPQQQLKPKPKIAASSALPPPSSDYRHRPERSSPERSARVPDERRPSSKRKSSEYEQEYDRRDDHHRESRDRDRENHSRHGSSHHHRADSSVARSSSPSPPAQQQQMSSKTLTSSKLKPSVFSRISFPEGEKDVAAEAGASKKRKMHSSSSDASAHHKASENGHRHEDYKISSSSKTTTSGSVTRKSASAAGDADYESSDDDRHFKRRPSRYESSPPTAIATDHEDSRYSRGTRDRERERERERERDRERDRDRDRGDRKHR